MCPWHLGLRFRFFSLLFSSFLLSFFQFSVSNIIGCLWSVAIKSALDILAFSVFYFPLFSFFFFIFFVSFLFPSESFAFNPVTFKAALHILACIFCFFSFPFCVFFFFFFCVFFLFSIFCCLFAFDLSHLNLPLTSWLGWTLIQMYASLKCRLQFDSKNKSRQHTENRAKHFTTLLCYWMPLLIHIWYIIST